MPLVLKTFLLACLLGTTACAPAPSPNPTEVAGFEAYSVRLFARFARGGAPAVASASGLELGRGLVLTASHVVEALPAGLDLAVQRGSAALPTRLVRRGNRETLDLAVLRVDAPASATPAPLPICTTNAPAGARVLVIGQGRQLLVTEVTQASPGYARLRATLLPGHSGAPALLLGQGCVAGLVSFAEVAFAPAGVTDGGTLLVDAATIQGFLGEAGAP